MRYSILLLTPWLVFCLGFDIKTRKRCCDLGTNYSTNGEGCKPFKPPIPEVAIEDERPCLNTIDFCCKKVLRSNQCNLGKSDAKNGSCPVEDSDRKTCCDACLLGFEAQKSGDTCIDSLGLGSPYSEAFTSCCEEITGPLTTRTSTPTSIASTESSATKFSKPFDHSYPGLSEANVCETGEFCAQLCESTGKTYKCSCFSGFELMKDGVSCKPIKRAKGSRCEKNNPCDHDCVDTGTSIECSCRIGYELATDQRSCKDINECELGTHQCLPNEECENDEGTYFCFVTDLDIDDEGFNKCPGGHKFNIEKSLCDDIDECEIPLICPPPKTCKNSIGSFMCEGPDCPPGFHYKTSIEACTDIDECLTPNNNCNKESQTCVNTKGNYTCVDKASRQACPPGFKKNEETLLCQDINECEENLLVCSQDEKCINEIGAYKCVKLTSTSLTKVFERNSTLVTTPTIPTCYPGYKYNAKLNTCDDINECQLRLDNCSPMHRCDNSVGSYYCTRIVSCGTGYTLNSAKDLCEDDDECALGTHKCYELGSNYACKNQMGTYRCEAIRPAYIPLPTFVTTTTTTTTEKIQTSTYPSTTAKTTYKPISITNPWGEPFYSNRNRKPWHFGGFIPNFITSSTVRTENQETPNYYNRKTTNLPIINGMLKKCLPGYRMNFKGDCEDIDECESNPCSKGLKCLNFNGYYQCSSPLHCKIGYEVDETGEECIDVDECARGTHSCSKTQICNNGIGYYSCDCPPGHHLNRLTQTCEDLDECKYRPCGNYAICTNTIGSFECSCKPGFKMNQKYCDDINECEETPELCEGTCLNMWGSYRCACKAGFTLNSDNRTCTDINECEKFKDRKLCIGTCVNVPGSYTCECPKGYRLGTNKRVCIGDYSILIKVKIKEFALFRY
ncbi:hypothetical protein ABEB36_010979 [Hypothenemus hampei]|uniref:EGF-like domain-containing protein n=1 Tax=Hypothenemus hampei TaxID=57062 RepID=A0ABD1EDU4_HYPHA